MTETNARLILASKNQATGVILYTFLLTFPRPILAEVNTHRMASKNTSSSRAIPGRKYRLRVKDDPFIPVSLGRNQKGMQAGEELSGWRRKLALAVIRAYRYPALSQSWLLEKIGVHKQVSNRYLEPWCWVQQVFSMTDLDNLLLLRDHIDAEPHFQIVAKQIRKIKEEVEAYLEQTRQHHPTSQMSNVQILMPGQWHLPFLQPQDLPYSLADRQKISIARSGRTSYRLLDSDKISLLSDDRDFYYKNIDKAYPKHLSPCEHQAEAMSCKEYYGNFNSWKQYRKFIPNESGSAVT